MNRMIEWRRCAVMLMTLVCGACAVVPTAPTYPALPGSGRDFNAFRRDDHECRRLAAAEVRPLAERSPLAGAEVRDEYDDAYTQCMYARGHKVAVSAEFARGLKASNAVPLPPHPPTTTPPPDYVPPPR